MRYHPHTTHERPHDENQPRNVVLFAGDVGLNTYCCPVAKASPLLFLVLEETIRRSEAFVAPPRRATAMRSADKQPRYTAAQMRQMTTNEIGLARAQNLNLLVDERSKNPNNGL